LMPMLFKLSSYYYGAFVGYAMLWPMSPGAGLALVSFAWLTNAISALWPNADQQSAWLSLAVVALVMGVTGALAWRRRAIDVGATPVGGQVEAEAEPRVTAATRGPSQDPLG
jgi:type VI protein secretion system component VasK